MDTDQTVFYLTPESDYALEIIQHPDNSSRTCQNPRDPKMLCLRIGLDQKSKSPPYLVSFGRRDHNDVILNKYFPKTDQCYFDFSKETGELLLHDISEYSDTQLTEIEWITNEDEDGDGDGERKEKLGYSQISRARRQCVVLLRPDLYHDRVERQWLFQIRDAEFRLLPGTTHGRSEAQLTKERLAFARNTNNDGTIKRTLQQLGTLDLQSKGLLAREPHSTWFRTSPKREKDKVIRIKKLKPLGRGGQGEVHEVVDMYTGAHYACKIVDPHIVPYTRTQESKTSHDIQIFMPVYEGNLHDLLQALRDQGQDGVRTITSKMLYQMLQALHFVHTHDPPIIHRDVKPPNILHRGGNFFLTDFGIAKAVDASNTVVGTGSYMAPELRENRQQTPKVDIWGLGVTVVECLEQPEDFRTRQFTEWEQWYEYLQTSLNQLHFPFASMVTVDTDRRPTARDLLQSWRTNVTLSSAAPPLSYQLNGTTTINSVSPILMDWTQTVPTTFVQLTQCDESMQLSQPKLAAIASLDVPLSPPAQPGARRGESFKSVRSRNEREKKGCKRKRSSQNGGAPSHSSGESERTPGRTLRPRPKRIRKAEER
ncbi:hypothetical protein BFJ66_g6068 [Fusarium oxysporum f. sp. cepae]|uniref:Protein kinase domain-containing protein n=1 Tax=Fusarium oxysporum f. sp. cepae TaxID=396571 RepID=A0A3L6NDN5_FUSOX|nr:hypothetical protein BFJ65_g9648 [Fusarium oxysporum f. sp. cepae]RKK51571.1 hypothetical protein BFJ66_g6068 [Fusarium oxysporum f. sp. cepae]RKK56500.1 hypothetical protein BFJ67_g3785 [Fusarium oxysporum f. sp. cepae]